MNSESAELRQWKPSSNTGVASNTPSMSANRSVSTKRSTYYIVISIFVSAIALLVYVFNSFPRIDEELRPLLVPPTSLENAKQLAKLLSLYTDTHYWVVVGAFCLTYIFLQAFSIPGSIFLSFLSGALFGLPVGLPLVCACATIGASCCYLLSYFIGRGIVERLFPQKLAWFGSELAKRRRNLFNYILFLRISPLLPNWFINIASPLLDVPLSYFAVGTFFGIMPATFVAVKAGLTLQELTSASDAVDVRTLATLFVAAFVVLLPTWGPVQRRLDHLFSRGSSAPHRSE